MSSAERARRIAFVLWVTLALNWSTALLKIVLGLTTQCMVVLADGFHSLSDGTSNIICLISVYLSGHPADHDHPYGHEKYETLASIIIAGLLLLVSFGIFQRAVSGFFHPRDPQTPPISFALMLLTFLVNIFVVLYERKKGRELQSELLNSDSWHTMTDIFVTLGVLVAMIGIRMDLKILDPVFSILIAALIGWVGFQIMRKSTDVLCDKAVLDSALVERIVRRTPGVAGCHEIRSRGKSYGIYVDLHVLVDPEMSVADSHRLANLVEHDLKNEFHGVRDVVVHIEPTTHDHKELEAT